MPASQHASVLAALLAAASIASAAMPEGHPDISGLPPGHPDVTDPEVMKDRMPEGHPPVSVRPSSTLFEVIAAGIAHHRKDNDFAAAALLAAAERERSAELARMAWEAALDTRDSAKLLAAAKLWVEIEPASEAARQTLIADALERNDREGVAQALKELDAAAKAADKSGWAGRLARLFARSPRAEAALVRGELAPYVSPKPSAEELLGHAALARAAGAPVEACRLAERALLQKPDDAETTAEAADVCWPAARETVRRMLTEHLKRHPDASQIRIMYAKTELRLGNRKKALQEADAAARRSPDEAAVQYNAGEIAVAAGDAATAERRFKAYLDAIERQGLSLDFSHLDVWLHLGDAALAQDRPEDAIEYWSNLTGGPFAADAALRRAVVLADLGRLPEARKVLAYARETLPPASSELYSFEARLLAEAGDARGSRRLLEEAVEKFPNEPDLLYDAALAAAGDGDEITSESLLRRLLALDPDHVHANNALGYLLVDAGRNLGEARSLLERAYRAAPMDPYILDSMGWLNYREGRFKAAAEFTRSSLKKLYDPEVARHLVEILMKLGRTDEAEKIYAELRAKTDEAARPELESFARSNGLLPQETTQ